MSDCRGCRQDIVWAITETGKRMPIDPARYDESEELANLAVCRDHHGSIRVRVLKDGDHLSAHEWRGMPHFASCPKLIAERDAKAGRLKHDGVLPMPKQSAAAPIRPTAASVTEIRPGVGLRPGTGVR